MKERKIIVFDGICLLCSAWVRFVLKRDSRREFQFAAMQSDSGRALLIQNGINPNDPVTFLLLDGDSAYTDTDAALRIVSRLGFGWQVLAAVIGIIPRGLRNACYRWIARNRYRFFGQRDACLLPSANEADRFLN
jgi:predicted DCC family thiol-disulfide oxidoreductase YuxK